MSWIRNRITTGLGITLSAIGVGAGVATTVVVAINGVSAVIIGISVAAPVGCAYHFLTSKGGIDAAKQIKQLDDTNTALQQTNGQLQHTNGELQQTNVKLGENVEKLGNVEERLGDKVDSLETQLSEMKLQGDSLAETVASLEQQKVDMAAEFLRFKADTQHLMQNLFIAGDKFDGFAESIAAHDEHLGNALERLDSAAERIDQTAELLLTRLNCTLDQQIAGDVQLRRDRALFFGGDAEDELNDGGLMLVDGEYVAQ